MTDHAPLPAAAAAPLVLDRIERAVDEVLARIDGDIVLAGDLAYPSGSPDDFKNCFNPSFGQFKSRIRPSPGNHEYVASVSAQGYFDYFGERSGSTRLGYYSYKAAEWTVLMLNSNVPIGKTSARASLRVASSTSPPLSDGARRPIGPPNTAPSSSGRSST